MGRITMGQGQVDIATCPSSGELASTKKTRREKRRRAKTRPAILMKQEDIIIKYRKSKYVCSFVWNIFDLSMKRTLDSSINKTE